MVRPAALILLLACGSAAAFAAQPAKNEPMRHRPVEAAHRPEAPAPAARHKPPPHPAPVVAAPAPAPPQPEPPEQPKIGSNTGLPIPRFASLKTDDVNMRAGPGTRYPIDWVYKRRDLPVEIEREFEVWRLVADPDGTKGWVHQATLTGRRSFVVVGGEQVMRADASDAASAVARLKPGVLGRLRSCAANSDWCQVSVGDYRGWLKRTAFWGALPGEAIQ